MTGRERLNRRHRPFVISLYGGFALALASGAIASFYKRSPISDYALVPFVMGIAVVIVSMWVIQFGIRCPFCRLRLGHLLFATGHTWGFGKNFNFCPKCGISLDQEISA